MRIKKTKAVRMEMQINLEGKIGREPKNM